MKFSYLIGSRISWHDITLTSPVDITAGGYYVDLTGVFLISLDLATRVDGVNFIKPEGASSYAVDAFVHKLNVRLIIMK